MSLRSVFFEVTLEILVVISSIIKRLDMRLKLMLGVVGGARARNVGEHRGAGCLIHGCEKQSRGRQYRRKVGGRSSEK